MNMKWLSISVLLTFSNIGTAEDFDLASFDELDYFDDFYGSEEMVEIATGIKTQIHKAPSVASVFTAKQIKQMGATDIDDVLETVPGLHISRSSNGYLPIYNFRSVHTALNAQVLMLINGIPITNNFSGNRNQVWGGMPVEAISRIEVIRGPGSALYGADAFSGVINIVTKNAKDIQKNEISLRAGSNNTHDAWLTVGGKNDELQYSAIVEYHKTDGSDQIIEADLQTILDSIANTNASLAPDKLSLATENLDFRGEVNYKDFTLRTGYQLRNNVGIGAGLAEALDPVANMKSDRFNIDANYKHEFTREFTVELQASYFNTSQEIKNQYTIFPAGSDAGLGGDIYTDGLIGNPEVWEKHQRINTTFNYLGLLGHKFRFGFGFYNSDLYRTRETKNFGLGADGNFIAPGSPLQDVSDTPYVFLHETDRENKYFFAQDIWNFSNDWELTAGIRYDDYSDFGSTINPRVALVWATSLNLTTKILYGKAFRAPSFADRGNINNPVALGNPNIKPEKMETAELVFDYHPADRLNFVLNFYRYTWNNIIQFVPDEGQSTNTAQNAGKQSAYGTEFEMSWQVHKKVKVSANYSFSKAENKVIVDDNITKNKTPFVPEQQWYAQIDWRVADDIKAHVRSNLVQNRKRNISDMRAPIDDYWLTDFTVRWNPIDYDYELSFIAKNIFNEDAREPSINNGSLINLPYDLPLGERMLLGEVRYKF